MEDRLNSMQETILRAAQKRREDIQNFESKLKSFDVELMKVNNSIAKLEKAVERSAKRSELKELENMIELFNPLKSTFISKQEVKRLLEEMK